MADSIDFGNPQDLIISRQQPTREEKGEFEYPPGYRFRPFDYELINSYLKKRIKNEPLPCNKIRDAELYKTNPDELAEKYQVLGEREWYFFTPRDRKYKNGTRPNRAAGNGYWKATGSDKAIKYMGVTVGYKKTLVFYQGKAQKGEKTNWMMYEYRVDQPPRSRQNDNDMRLDDWVLCRLYKNDNKSTRNTRQSEESEFSTPITEGSVPTDDVDVGETINDYNYVAVSNGLVNTYGGYFQPSLHDGNGVDIPAFDVTEHDNHTFNGEWVQHLPFRRPFFPPQYVSTDCWESKLCGVEEEDWEIPSLDIVDAPTLQFDTPRTSYMEPMLNVDTHLLNNVQNNQGNS